MKAGGRDSWMGVVASFLITLSCCYHQWTICNLGIRASRLHGASEGSRQVSEQCVFCVRSADQTQLHGSKCCLTLQRGSWDPRYRGSALTQDLWLQGCLAWQRADGLGCDGLLFQQTEKLAACHIKETAMCLPLHN